MSQQIYSLPPLAAWVSPQIPRRTARRARSSSEARYGGAGGGNRTPDPLITNQPLYLLSYASRQSPSIFKGLPLGKSFLLTSRTAKRIHPAFRRRGMHSIPTTESLSTPTRVWPKKDAFTPRARSQNRRSPRPNRWAAAAPRLTRCHGALPVGRRSTSSTVISGGDRNRMRGPQVPVPRLT
jgi:hypothetical protein